MQVDTAEYLSLLEKSGGLLFVDIEASGLRGDYNTCLVVSGKEFGKKPISHHVRRVGDDKALVISAKKMLEGARVWVTYYGKGFDLKFLNTRLLRHGQPPIGKRPHLDMYYSLKAATLTARRSQGHLLSWLETPQEKMTVGASVWADMGIRFGELMPKMVARCESDVKGLEALYKRTRHLIVDISR